VLDIISQQGALAVLRYFSALVVSVVLLTQPVVVIFLDLLLGVGSFPDVLTLFGCVIVMTGCGLVLVSNAGVQRQTFDASAMLHKAAFETPLPSHSSKESILKTLSLESLQHQSKIALKKQVSQSSFFKKTPSAEGMINESIADNRGLDSMDTTRRLMATPTRPASAQASINDMKMIRANEGKHEYDPLVSY